MKTQYIFYCIKIDVFRNDNKNFKNVPAKNEFLAKITNKIKKNQYTNVENKAFFFHISVNEEKIFH